MAGAVGETQPEGREESASCRPQTLSYGVQDLPGGPERAVGDFKQLVKQLQVTNVDSLISEEQI